MFQQPVIVIFRVKVSCITSVDDITKYMKLMYSFLVLFFIMSFLCLIAAAFLKDRKPWIVKPVASSRGRGIYLVSHVSSLIKCFSGNNCYSNGLICILTISDSLSAT